MEYDIQSAAKMLQKNLYSTSVQLDMNMPWILEAVYSKVIEDALEIAYLSGKLDGVIYTMNVYEAKQKGA